MDKNLSFVYSYVFVNAEAGRRSRMGTINILLEHPIPVFIIFDICCDSGIDSLDIEIHLEIQRDDGEIELYPLLNETYHAENSEYPDRGLRFLGSCDSTCCFNEIQVSPTDLRYNGAQITGIADIHKCFNITRSMTLKKFRVHNF